MPRTECHWITRPLLGDDDECGDLAIILQLEQTTFLALIDALGHGRAAHGVAVTAKEYLTRSQCQDPVELMNGLHGCLRGTNGAVAAFCWLDWASGVLNYVGMGNITVRVLGSTTMRFVPREGILGYVMATPRQETARLLPGDVLVMHSDGIQEHFELYDRPELLSGSAKVLAEELVRLFGRSSDDACCIVLRYLA